MNKYSTLTNEGCLTFGKYHGINAKDVYRTDKSYIEWLRLNHPSAYVEILRFVMFHSPKLTKTDFVYAQMGPSSQYLIVCESMTEVNKLFRYWGQMPQCYNRRGLNISIRKYKSLNKSVHFVFTSPYRKFVAETDKKSDYKHIIPNETHLRVKFKDYMDYQVIAVSPKKFISSANLVEDKPTVIPQVKVETRKLESALNW